MFESKPTVPGLEDGVEYEVQRFKVDLASSLPPGVGPQVDEARDNITDGIRTSPQLSNSPLHARFYSMKPRPTGGAIGNCKGGMASSQSTS